MFCARSVSIAIKPCKLARVLNSICGSICACNNCNCACMACFSMAALRDFSRSVSATRSAILFLFQKNTPKPKLMSKHISSKIRLPSTNMSEMLVTGKSYSNLPKFPPIKYPSGAAIKLSTNMMGPLGLLLRQIIQRHASIIDVMQDPINMENTQLVKKLLSTLST